MPRSSPVHSIFTRLALIALLALFTAAATACHAAPLTLADQGRPAATIVVARDALTAPFERKVEDCQSAAPAAQKISAAAHDLQLYIEKISGAKLPIVSDEKDPGGTLILVGKSRLTQPLDQHIPAGLTIQRTEEGLVLFRDGNRLLLAGNDAGPYHGTEYAVAAFLHRLGVRWYMPVLYGDVFPKQPTIAINDLNITQKPDFIMRNQWVAVPEGHQLEWQRWKIRNMMNPVLAFVALPNDSSISGVLPPPADAGKPEFAGVFGKNADGSPSRTMPDLTSAKSVAFAAGKINDYFRTHKEADSWGIGPDDGNPMDWSPETMKSNLGFPDVGGRVGVTSEVSTSEEWIRWINAVTAQVNKEFPDHAISTNGYANRNTPPQGMKIDPHVWVMFAAIWSDTLHAYNNPRSWQAMRQGQMIEAWARLCPHVYMYDYTYYMLASAGTPIPLSRKHMADFPLLKKWGVVGFSDEGRTVLAESGIYPYYLRARLMWDAGQNGKAVVDEFFTNWYGPAKAPAFAFWDAIEETMESTPVLGHEDRILPYVYSPELIARLKVSVAAEQAAAQASGDATVIKHAEADRLIFAHLQGYLAMTAAEWAGDFTEAAHQADEMLARRRDLAALSPFYCDPDAAGHTPGLYYWDIADRRDYYKKVAAKLSGQTGAKVALLSDRARFHTDPTDEGRFAGWYEPAFPHKDWQTFLTTKPFYLQDPSLTNAHGYPYMGAIWYRFEADVPASAAGHKVSLYCPTVEPEAWVWVNGQLVGHRPYHDAYERPTNDLDLDITSALHPGQKNTIAVRVSTGTNPAQAAGGFYSRAFLYAPK